MSKKSKIEIIPAVMPIDFDDLVAKLEMVNGAVDWVQIDIMDKKFTNSISWPYSDSKHFEKIYNQDEGFPFWDGLNFEIDMMIVRPLEEIQKWIDAGAGRVVLHIKTLVPGDELLIKKIKEESVLEISLCLSTDMELSELDRFEGLYDAVQFMGIAKEGFQGEPFEPSILEKIKELKIKKSEIPISVDGGISFENIKDLISVGVTRLVSGSMVFESVDVKGTIKEIEHFIKSE